MALFLGAELMVLPDGTRAAFLSSSETERAVASDRAATRAAFEAMARAHHEGLVAFSVRLSGSQSDARDLVQDTLERALRRFDAFTPGTNERAWLFSILHHAFIDRCRRRKTEPRSESIDDVELASHAPEEPPRWTSITAEQLALAISQLDEEFRAVYQLHAADGLSYQAISEKLGIPVNTVGTRLSRARKKLRALLEPTMSPASERGGTR